MSGRFERRALRSLGSVELSIAAGKANRACLKSSDPDAQNLKHLGGEDGQDITAVRQRSRIVVLADACPLLGEGPTLWFPLLWMEIAEAGLAAYVDIASSNLSSSAV